MFRRNDIGIKNNSASPNYVALVSKDTWRLIRAISTMHVDWRQVSLHWDRLLVLSIGKLSTWLTHRI